MKRKERPIGHRQAVERPLQQVEVGRPVVVWARRRWQLLARVGQRPHRDLADDPAASPADRGPAGVDDDSPEPGREAIGVAKLRQIAPDPQKDLLRGISRVGLVAEDGQGGPEGRGQPSVDEGSERLVLSEAGALHEGHFARSDRRCLQDDVHDRVVPRYCRVQRMTPHS